LGYLNLNKYNKKRMGSIVLIRKYNGGVKRSQFVANLFIIGTKEAIDLSWTSRSP
jgi:hypothetical protein